MGMNKKQIALVDLELHVEEGENKENSTCSRRLCVNLFLIVKKRYAINLKMCNQFVPFLHFKMEGLSFKVINTGGRLDLQI